MAHHASTLKRLRQATKQRARNRMNRTNLRTQVKKLLAAVAQSDVEAARNLLPPTIGKIDRAAKKHIIHDNAAARYKSRLTHRVNALSAN